MPTKSQKLIRLVSLADRAKVQFHICLLATVAEALFYIPGKAVLYRSLDLLLG